MPHLNKLHEKYSNQGLSIIAVTGENQEVVQAFSVHHTEMNYKVYTKSSHQGFPEGKGIPQAYIIGADGSLLWEGHPSSLSDKKIEEFLKERAKFFLTKFEGASKSSISDILQKKYGSAYKYAEKNKQKIGAAQDMFDFLEVIANREMSYGKELVQNREYLKAYQFFNTMKKTWNGTSFSKEAEKIQKECKSSDTKKEFSALEKLEQLVAKIPSKDKDKARLADTLKSFASHDKYKDTKAAENALSWVKTLESSWP